MEMNGGKRIYQRLGGAGKVCNYWMQGRCNRHPCPYLHGDPSQKQPRQSSSDDKRTQQPGNSRGGFVWRNPNLGGAPSKWGRGRGAPPGAPPGGNGPTAPGKSLRKGGDTICKFFLKGRCSYGEACKFLHAWSIGEDFSLLTKLEGHQKVRELYQAETGTLFLLGLFSGYVSLAAVMISEAGWCSRLLQGSLFRRVLISSTRVALMKP